MCPSTNATAKKTNKSNKMNRVLMGNDYKHSQLYLKRGFMKCKTHTYWFNTCTDNQIMHQSMKMQYVSKTAFIKDTLAQYTYEIFMINTCVQR